MEGDVIAVRRKKIHNLNLGKINSINICRMNISSPSCVIVGAVTTCTDVVGGRVKEGAGGGGGAARDVAGMRAGGPFKASIRPTASYP